MLSLSAQPFKPLHLPPPNSFASQTVIITGVNTGLVLETAQHVASLGVRTLSKGLSAKAYIEKTTSRTGIIEVWELDLSRFSSVVQTRNIPDIGTLYNVVCGAVGSDPAQLVSQAVVGNWDVCVKMADDYASSSSFSSLLSTSICNIYTNYLANSGTAADSDYVYAYYHW